ncbi:MAG: response regulator transcription factor [Acetobacter sp.]|nr:response regulator transcription factor [Bacteroides sp.]MCM1341310.1 response regulator transcription factor [Acetobacter sp.]MCM1433914.1 response regulator transcription factor [Clostridiales bacterium]
MRILIAEDETDLNNIIKQKMIEEGFCADSCYDGEDALYYMQNAKYDAVIMDVMMPKMDGFTAVEKYRISGGSAPILFLTAKDSISDKVYGLDLGANDYLTKPFSFDELTARIRALTRINSGNVNNVYTLADLSLDSSSKIVKRGDRVINLSAKEFSLLEYLIRNKEKVLSREQIENNIYNFDYEGGTNVVDVYIRYLRKKIDEDFDVKLIHTVRGIGYVLGIR